MRIHIISTFHYDVVYLREYRSYLEESIRILDRALDLLESEPDYPPTLRNLGYCLYRQKKLLAAKEVLEHCLAVGEGDDLAAEYYLKVPVSLKRNKDAK